MFLNTHSLLIISVISAISTTRRIHTVAPIDRINLDCRITKVVRLLFTITYPQIIDELRRVKKSVNAGNANALEFVIETLTQSETLFLPDLQGQCQFLDNDIRKWYRSNRTLNLVSKA